MTDILKAIESFLLVIIAALIYTGIYWGVYYSIKAILHKRKKNKYTDTRGRWKEIIKS